MITTIISILIAATLASLCCKPTFRYVNIEQINNGYYLRLYFRRGFIPFARYNNGYGLDFGEGRYKISHRDVNWNSLTEAERYYDNIVDYFKRIKESKSEPGKLIIKSSRDKIKIEEPEFNNPQIEEIVRLSLDGKHEEARELEKELILKEIK
jgi:hypothetical protein